MSILKKTTGLLLLLGAGTIVVMALQKPKPPTDTPNTKDEPQPAGGEGFIWPDGSKHAIPFDPVKDSAKLEPSQTQYPTQPAQPVYLPVSPPSPTVSVSQPLPPPVSYYNPGNVPVNNAYSNNGAVALAGFNFYN